MKLTRTAFHELLLLLSSTTVHPLHNVDCIQLAQEMVQW